MARVNCAVYVRKSTEKGLELEFNSLHNQEDACQSYIMSQAFNNWEYFKTYTDGGISGGTMERPALKQINFTGMDYFAQRNFIRNFINKIIYQKDRLTFSFNTDQIILSAYTGDSLNENNNPLEFIADIANNQIIYEKQVVINRGLSSNVYNAGKIGLMSINDNNRLIVRAFAYAWKFKKLYEKDIRMEDIMKQEKMTKRTIYKYLNLAYLSPRIVNQLLNGTLTINLQTLFEVASKNLSFEEQEIIFLSVKK